MYPKWFCNKNSIVIKKKLIEKFKIIKKLYYNYFFGNTIHYPLDFPIQKFK